MSYNEPRDGVTFDVSDGSPKEIRFLSPFPCGHPEVDRAKAYLYEAKNSNEAVLFLHGVGRRRLAYLKFYPTKLLKMGFTALMPVLPFHYERVVPGHESYDTFIKGSTQAMESKFYQAVVDVRTCIDFLENAGYEHIHIMGVSSGGMVAVITMAVDHRIERGALVITGGNLEIVSWHSIATKIYRIGKSWRAHKKKSIEIQKEFDDCARSFSSIEDIERIPSFFRYDPSMFAKLIDNSRVIMFSALLDPWIPKKASDDLWRRLGEPNRCLLPSGHLTAHLFFKRFILRRSVSFLRR